MTPAQTPWGAIFTPGRLELVTATFLAQGAPGLLQPLSLCHGIWCSAFERRLSLASGEASGVIKALGIGRASAATRGVSPPGAPPTSLATVQLRKRRNYAKRGFEERACLQRRTGAGPGAGDTCLLFAQPGRITGTGRVHQATTRRW